MRPPASIALLKVTLDHVEPRVMRRLEVPLDLRLDRLHAVLQAVLGWTDSHLWELRAREVGWGIPDPDWGSGPLDARKTTLKRVIEDTGAKTLAYLYDFGDGWEHTIKIERIGAPAAGASYPRLTEAVGHCPPEDVGGPWGYEEFLAAHANPEHERHDEIREWHPEPFNPHEVDLAELDQALQQTIRRWSRPRRTTATT